jgi:uridylate kinase
MGKQGVDGVYDADPKVDPTAVKYDELSYDEFLTRGLKVADATAISLCRDNDIEMIVFNLSAPGTIARVVQGERIGTTISRTVPAATA